MSRVSQHFIPDAISMVRMDHTHVVAVFHRYRVDLPAHQKRGLVNLACVALEVHASLEEEIFYPAVMAVLHDKTTEKSVPEHNEMRALIAKLRAMSAHDPAFDDTFMALMRDVLHHVADEETDMLPNAERLLTPSHLKQLGVEMTKRRLQLAGPKIPGMAADTAKAFPLTAIALVAVACMGFLTACGRSRA